METASVEWCFSHTSTTVRPLFHLHGHHCPHAFSRLPGSSPPVPSAPGRPALLPLLCPLLSDQSLLRGSRAWDPASLSLFLTGSFSHLILSIICAVIDSEMSVSGKVAISRSSGLTYPTAVMLGPQAKSWVSMWPTQLSMPSAPCPCIPFPVQ